MGLDPISIIGLAMMGGSLIGGATGAGTTAPHVETGSSLTPEQDAMSKLLLPYISNNLGKKSSESRNLSGVLTEVLSKVKNGGILGTVYDPQNTTDYFNQGVLPSVLKNFKDFTLPQIGESYSGPGTFWGSERANAEADATTNLQSTLAQQLAGLQYQDRKDWTTNRLNADYQNSMLANTLAGTINQMDSQYLQAALAYLGTPMMYSVMNQGDPGIWPGLMQMGGSLVGAGLGKK